MPRTKTAALITAAGCLAAIGAVASHPGTAVSSPPVIAETASVRGSGFVPLTPERILDTRSGVGAPAERVGDLGGAGRPLELMVSGTDVPMGASAVALNVTVVEGHVGPNGGYVTVYPCGARPDASNLNFTQGQTVPNTVIAPLSPRGSVCLYVFGTAHLLADISGYFTAGFDVNAVGQTGFDLVVQDNPAGVPQGVPGALYPNNSWGRSNWSEPEMVAIWPGAWDGIAIAQVDVEQRTVTVRQLEAGTFAGRSRERVLSFSDWEIFGGIHAGSDGHLYVLVGQPNYTQDNDRVVIEIRRYDQTLDLVGVAHIRGGFDEIAGEWGIYDPFAGSAADMLIVGDRLVVHMARLIYLAPDGLHHQVNLTFEVDTASMAVTGFGWDRSYVSHSFRQSLAHHGTALVFADHGDAYPRSIAVGVMEDFPSSRSVQQFDMLKMNGEDGDNYTGSTLTDAVAGDGFVHVAGTSIQHPNAPTGTLGPSTETRNAYLATLNLNSSAVTMNWLTRYPATANVEVGEPRILQLDDTRTIVMFQVRQDGERRLEYRVVNQSGTVIASRTFDSFTFHPAHRPVVINDSVVWASWSGIGAVGGGDPRLLDCSSSPWFQVACRGYSLLSYSLNITDPSAPALETTIPVFSP